ncbi:MAG: DUF4199 domain-containing protein [Gemmatimonadota bacterium]|nr:DUF4199 domain-containing protein [Gemmatimonadota bacterium]
MKRIAWTFGLIAGALLSVMMVITMSLADRIDFDKGEIVGYTTMVLAFLMVFFGIRSYRDNVAGGVVSFGRAFLIGLSITAIASACYVATWELVYYKMMPDFGDKYAAHVLAKAKASGASEQQLAKQTREMEQFKELYKNPIYNIGMTFLEPLPVGLVITLVCAGILRKKREDPVLISGAAGSPS